MEDERIIDLYWQRSEEAIRQTDKKYGRFCISVAGRILDSREDVQECVSDTYLQTWNSLPPQRPAYFRAFLGKITRNLALNRFAHNRAQKRYSGFELILEEYAQCADLERLPLEDEYVLGQALNHFLEQLPSQTRIIFLQRYWYACSVKEIAADLGLSQGNVKVILHRTREKLKAFLEREEIFV